VDVPVAAVDEAVSEVSNVVEATNDVVVATSKVSVAVNVSVEDASITVEDAVESEVVAVCAATYWIPSIAKIGAMMIPVIVAGRSFIIGQRIHYIISSTWPVGVAGC
jgi:hypothetical protein